MTTYPRSIALILLLATAAASGQSVGTALGGLQTPSLTIPPSGSGSPSCNPTDTIELNFPSSGTLIVHSVRVVLDIDHTFAGDLEIELEHLGTTVTLMMDQGSSTNLSGDYEFRDDAAAVFAPGDGPGAYLPVSGAFADFQGLPFAGGWKLTVCDDQGFDVGLLHAATVHVTFASPSASFPIAANTVIPGGSGGPGNPECSAPVSFAVNLPPTTDIVKEVKLEISLNALSSGHLDIRLHHGGVSAPLVPLNAFSGSDFAGTYEINNNPSNPIVPISGDPIVDTAQSYYAPALDDFVGIDPSGAWYLTICDMFAGPAATGGQVHAADLTIVTSRYTLEFSQESSTEIRFATSNGTPGNLYFTPVAVNNVQNGWFFGLEIPINLLSPFFSSSLTFGVLDANGSMNESHFGLIPPGIPLSAVSVEVQGGAPLRASDVVSIVTF